MSEERSYRIQNFAANVDGEVRRLKAQVELFWDKELKLYRAFGLRDGMDILECGSGPGHILEKLLLHVPGTHVTGVEIDPFLVQKSKETLASFGAERHAVVEQSIMRMGFPDNRFDFAIARLVLEHLPDAIGAAKEVLRVLKPGAKAIFIDNDFDMHLRAFPDIPELHELYDAYCRCRVAEGGNPRIGRELPGLLQEAGFSNVDMEIVSAHSRVIGDEAFLKSEGSGIPSQLVKGGYLSRDVLDRLARKWHDALQQKHHVFFRQLFVASGEKGSSQPGHAAAAEQSVTRDAPAPALAGLLRAVPGDRAGMLTDYLRAQVAASLRVEPSRIEKDQPLLELGVDSIASVELANRIAGDLGLSIAAVDILEAQSLQAVAGLLDSRIAGAVTSGHAAAAPATGTGDSGWEDGEI